MSLSALLANVLIMYFILTGTSNCNLNATWYNRYSQLDGTKCIGYDREFVKTDYDRALCATNCLQTSACKSFMYVQSSRLCIGCNTVYTSSIEFTVQLDSEPDSEYWIDKDFESHKKLIRINEDSGFTDRGRLEVRYQGIWGTVCDDRWYNHLMGYEQNNLDVACHSLGFNGGGELLPYGSYMLANDTHSEVPIWMDDVECNVTMQNIIECPFLGYGSHDCTHWEDVSLQCYLEDSSVQLP